MWTSASHSNFNLRCCLVFANGAVASNIDHADVAFSSSTRDLIVNNENTPCYSVYAFPQRRQRSRKLPRQGKSSITDH
eukprot:6180825-Pleurochrysis_carterae.AAC.2